MHAFHGQPYVAFPWKNLPLIQSTNDIQVILFSINYQVGMHYSNCPGTKMMTEFAVQQ